MNDICDDFNPFIMTKCTKKGIFYLFIYGDVFFSWEDIHYTLRDNNAYSFCNDHYININNLTINANNFKNITKEQFIKYKVLR